MPSAKARAAKAAIAARVAATNAAADEAAAAAALANGTNVNANGITANIPSTNATVMPAMNTPLQPALPSMLNLNTAPNMHRALSIGAVTMSGTANVGSTSDEENVQPPGLAVPVSITTSSKVGKDVNVNASAKANAKAKANDEPPLQPTSPLVGGDRESRAFEHDRQKMKRAGEFARRKARKAATAVGKVAEYGEVGRKGRGVGVLGRDMDVDGDEDVLPVGTGGLKKGPFSVSFASNVKAEAPIQVNLSDLVVLSQRKPRKVLGGFLHRRFKRLSDADAVSSEDDFEFIPAVRSVIVLDDMADARDMDLDEPWEHVESDIDMDPIPRTDKPGAEPSYAAILVGR